MSRRKGDTREKTRQNALKCLQLRAQGYTYRQIAAQLGYRDHSAVIQIIQREIVRLPRVEAREVRRIDCEQLDEMAAAFLPKAINEQNENAAAIVLKVMERKAKLLGLDAPSKVAQTDSEGRDVASYAPTQQLLAVLAAKANVQIVHNGNGNGHTNGHHLGNGNGHQPSGN